MYERKKHSYNASRVFATDMVEHREIENEIYMEFIFDITCGCMPEQLWIKYKFSKLYGKFETCKNLKTFVKVLQPQI